MKKYTQYRVKSSLRPGAGSDPRATGQAKLAENVKARGQGPADQGAALDGMESNLTRAGIYLVCRWDEFAVKKIPARKSSGRDGCIGANFRSEDFHAKFSSAENFESRRLKRTKTA